MKTARTGKPWKLLLIAGLAKARRPQNGTLRATTHSKRKRRPGAYRRRSAAVLRAQRKTWR
jgi:hypothetical protein